MRFIMKHMSKKMLSVILALMVLLSAVSVAFSAIAGAPAEPYVVTNSKPAIAMLSGLKLDLTKISVEFDEDEIIPGDEITWTVTPNSALLFDEANAALTVFKPGSYVVTATKTDEPDKARTINVFASEERATQVEIYNHEFTADDIDASGEFKTSTGWKIVRTKGTAGAAFANGAITVANASTAAYIVLDPLSPGGQVVSSFSDVTVEANIFSPKHSVAKVGWYGIISRLTYENNIPSTTPVTQIATLYKYCSALSRKSAFRFDINQVTGAQVNSDVQISNSTTNAYKMQLLGSNLTASWAVNGATEFSAVDYTLSSDQTAALAETNGVCGTIAFYSDENARTGITSIKVSVGFTEDELDKIAEACEDHGYYMVNPNKPAIPVTVGKTLNLNAALVEFASGDIVTGDNISWDVKTGNAAIFNKEAGTVSIFKAGTYEATATYKPEGQDEVVQKVYIFASDIDLNEVEIYKHTFSDADVVDGEFTAESEWKTGPSRYTNDRKLVFLGTSGTSNYNGVTFYLKSPTDANFWLGDLTDGDIYLDPTSESGKFLKDFADINIETNVITHTRYGHTDVGYIGTLGRLDLGDNAALDSTDTKVSASYRTASSAASHTQTSLRVNISGTSKDFAQEFNAISGQTAIHRLEMVGNTIKTSLKSISAATANEAQFTLTADQQAGLNATAGKGGTIGVYIGNNTRTAIQSIRVTISFTADEKKAAEALYAESPYHIIGANKPAIPVKTSTKVNFDGLIFEMADGSFMEAKDIYWDNPYGALKFQDNAVYTYSDGFYTVKAKKSQEDTEGRDIYFITPNEDGEYQLYEHTFTAADIDENGVFTPESEWKSTLSGGYSTPKLQYSETNAGVVILGDSTNDEVANPWFGDTGSGALFLDPNSTSGKLVSKFSDITLELRVRPSVRFNHEGVNSVGPAVRIDLGPNNAWDSTDAQVQAMYRIPRSAWVELGVNEKGDPINGPDEEKNKTVVNISVTGAKFKEALQQDFPLIHGQINKLKVQAVGPTVKTWADTDGKGYTEITGIELTEAQQNNLNSTVGKSGHTIGFIAEATTRTALCGAKATITFSEEEMAKFVSTEISPLYNVMQDLPAIPMAKATKISLDKLLIELPDGNFTTGENLSWSTDYVGSNFLIDDATKEIYAYGSGRYDVTIKDGKKKIMDAHIVVADDYGNYKIFEHTFTKEDADAIAEDGSSDMWIASTHSLKSARDAGLLDVNSITHMAAEWKNRVSALTLNSSLQFDPTKGISIYTNDNNLLTLNPEHKEAKIISKFSDYIIDFTSTARDKDIAGYNWTQKGLVGAFGRVDFGEDKVLSFANGTYMPNTAVSYEHNRLAAKVGVVTPLSKINNLANPGEEYTWTVLNGADVVTIDNKAHTIVATTPGIYNIEGTKAGADKVTVSFIVPHEDYLDHMVGGIFGVNDSPYLSVLTYKGVNGTANKYTGNNTFSVPVTNQTFKYTIPETYNYRLVLNGNNISFSVAPNGTANFAELYNSVNTPLTMVQSGYMDASNKKTGTISLFTNGSSRAWFKSVSVSLDLPAMPSGYLVSLGECRDEEDRIIYLNVGETLNLKEINFEVGERYYNGEAISFKKKPAGLKIVDGVSITPTKAGVYNLTAIAGGEEFDITVAVSAAGSIFDNGNYEFGYENGAITSYNRVDLAQPYSEKIIFPAEHKDGHVYEVGSALAMGNPGNKQIVELEIGKYIEKIGSGAFLDATKLKVITLPNTVETIGASAFAGAIKLTDVFLPASVSSIEDNAFRNCNNIVVVISNKDAVIGETVFTGDAVIIGYKGSTAEEYATKNGLEFKEIEGVNLDKAERSIKDYVKIVYDRYNKVNETVKFEISSVESEGSWRYSISGMSFTDRSAGKFVMPKEVEITNREGKKETVSVYPGVGMMDSKVDSRAIYALELEEGVTSTGFWAFRNCYNLKYLKLPETLTTIAQQTFLGCTSLETVDIPKSVMVIGLYSFDYCTNLKEVNIDPDGMLQAYGTNAVRKTEVPGRVFYETKVEKFVAPISVDWVTNSLVNFGAFKEAWIYNKDCDFTIATDAQQYYFPRNTVIHGVPGSTAEAIVKEDQARGESEDPAERLLFRNLTFVGDIKDFYEEREGVLDENAKFFGSLVEYEEIKEDEFKPLENPYYVLSRYQGIGGKVIMPSHIEIGGKRVPVYAISASFQFEGVPTNGLPKIINLEIQDGIAVIEDEVFSNAAHLKTIKLPNTLKYIGKKAFTGAGLTGKLEIPASVQEIGNAAFRNLSNLTDIVIYNPNMKFGGGIFDRQIKIHGIAGSTAEEYATRNGHEFVAIDAPKAPSVNDFKDNGNYKFSVDKDGYITGYEIVDESKDYSLKIKIPAKINGKAIKGIKEGTFNNPAVAGSIIAVEIAEGIEEIGARSFKGLLKLSFITFPKTLKIIGESAFEGTALMGDITLPEGLERIDRNAFKSLNGISSIKILSRTVVIDPTGLPRTNPNLVIYGYTNSTAELWCQNFKINFQYLDGGPQPETPPEQQPGDQLPEDQQPGDQLPGEQQPGDQLPGEQQPGDQLPGDQQPGDQQPGDQQPGQQQPGQQPGQQPDGNKKPIQQDGQQTFNEIIRVIRQSNVGIVIIIAIAMLMLSVLLAAVVVVIVVVKKKQEMDEQLQ